MKTILITGASSGFGLETAKYFLERGWKVIATMRTPNQEVLPRSENLRILPLDVTNEDSIRKTVLDAGPIDVLVNNAGIGALTAAEGASMKLVREIFDTNTLGTIAMTQAVIPQFRERRVGMIVNVTSTVTLKALPLLAIYTASKAAINAFSESLALELKEFNIRVGVILPGRAPETKFGENGQKAQRIAVPEAYSGLFAKVMTGWGESTDPVTSATDVAEAIWRTVNESSTPILLPAGADAVMWAKEYGL